MSAHVLRTFALATTLGLGLASLPTSLRAQSASTASDGRSVDATALATPQSAAPAAVPSGPRLAPAGISTRDLAAVPTLPPRDDQHVGIGSNLALMGVGAAALIIGLVVGGDGGTVVAIGGGVIGLVGLYRYLR